MPAHLNAPYNPSVPRHHRWHSTATVVLPILRNAQLATRTSSSARPHIAHCSDCITARYSCSTNLTNKYHTGCGCAACLNRRCMKRVAKRLQPEQLA
eukprot:752498-Amphidinium_carterae.1